MAVVNKFNVNSKIADIKVSSTANDVSYDDSFKYDENTVGDKLSELNQQIIYDVSAHNDGAVFESLQSLLSSPNLNILIPTSVRCGGISIQFIQSSDNKYVQYKLMSTLFSVNEDDWQSLNADNEPIEDSDNLVKSGGVYPLASRLYGLHIEPVYYFKQLFNKDFVGNLSGKNWEYGGDGYLINSSGKIVVNTTWFTSNLIHWNGKNKAYCGSVRSIVQYDNQMNIVSVYYPSSAVSNYYLTRENNASYFKISVLLKNKSVYYVNYDKQIGNETYREFRYNVIEYFEQLESYVLSESFRPANLTWSEGLPNTPIDVWYPSGYEGQISFVRNVNTGLIIDITATMNIQEDTLTLTLSLMRDNNGNITKILTKQKTIN